MYVCMHACMYIIAKQQGRGLDHPSGGAAAGVDNLGGGMTVVGEDDDPVVYPNWGARGEGEGGRGDGR